MGCRARPSLVFLRPALDAAREKSQAGASQFTAFTTGLELRFGAETVPTERSRGSETGHIGCSTRRVGEVHGLWIENRPHRADAFPDR